MGFSPVECVVRYVGMEDRYTLKHSYVRLPRQESFSKSHRLKPSAPTCYPLYHFWDRLYCELSGGPECTVGRSIFELWMRSVWGL